MGEWVNGKLVDFDASAGQHKVFILFSVLPCLPKSFFLPSKGLGDIQSAMYPAGNTVTLSSRHCE